LREDKRDRTQTGEKGGILKRKAKSSRRQRPGIAALPTLPIPIRSTEGADEVAGMGNEEKKS